MGFLRLAFCNIVFCVFWVHVLFNPGTDMFLISTLLLLAGTGLLLWGITYVYLFFDKSIHAPLKFGIVGTIIGLALDTFTLANYHFIFPKLDDSQVIAFTAWMSFAYALYLLIPFMINLQRTKMIDSSL